MNEIKNIFRYSLPGWILILILFLYGWITSIIAKDFLEENFYNVFFSIPTDNIPSVAFSLLIAGIPLGFILSQIYYLFSNRTNNDIYRFHREKFEELMLIFMPELKEINDEKKFDKLYRKNHQIYYSRMFSYLRNNLEKDDENLKREQNLSDMSHGLGASYYSIILSFVVYSIFLIIYIYSQSSFDCIFCRNLIIAFFINTFIAIFLVEVFKRNRRNIMLHQITIYEVILKKAELIERKQLSKMRSKIARLLNLLNTKSF
jgi:hypothetical protein